MHGQRNRTPLVANLWEAPGLRLWSGSTVSLTTLVEFRSRKCGYYEPVPSPSPDWRHEPRILGLKNDE